MEILKLVRQNILDLKPYASARDLYNNPGLVLLDANENNFGSTFEEIPGLELNRYPDPRQNEMRELIEKTFGISRGKLFFGVGSDEIIDLLTRIFCEPGKDNAIIPSPTFGMYKACCDINNIEAREIQLNDNFQIDKGIIESNYDKNTKLIFLCSPNNPTGSLLNKDGIISLCKNYNAIVIVDEAYIDFANGGSVADEVNNYPNLVVLRTFSKAWGLAGIRLGYSIANPAITEILFKVKTPYNINSLTRYAFQKAIENSGKKDKYVASIIKERERVKSQLECNKGVLKIFDSDSNYLLVKVGDARTFQKKLADKGVIVRDRSSQPKLEGCVRISIGTEKENDLLLKAIKEIL